MSWNNIKGRGVCPHCSKMKVNKFNNLEYLNPELAKEWHPTKNGDLKPDSITSGNGRIQIWWKCTKDDSHEWQTPIFERRKRGCPFCDKKRASKTYNLLVKYPQLCEEWDYDKNESTPDKYTPYAYTKVWWKCKKCSYSWQTLIASRTKESSGCLSCSHHRATPQNCLQITHPSIAQEWDYIKNDKITPLDVTYGSNEKVWWKCSKCNHSWKTMVKIRSMGSGCIKCSLSKGELRVLEILDKYKVVNLLQYEFDDCKNIFSLPFDFYLPEYNILVEVQGIQHYKPTDFEGKGLRYAEIQFKKQQKRDKIKRDYCNKNKIKLLEIPYWDFDNIEEILIKELGLHVNT